KLREKFSDSTLAPLLKSSADGLVIGDSPLQTLEQKRALLFKNVSRAPQPEEGVGVDAHHSIELMKINSDYIDLSKNFREKQNLESLVRTELQDKMSKQFWHSKANSKSRKGIGFTDDSSDDDSYYFVI
ncbi:hypothetical protein, partial [Klebsiella pneumoniae]|uniref:hypothetical protein n=1 Tax=Klebsiella pneumoniae TaxID=573 RepID=UPI0013724D7B